jgi:hypothetical protein
MYAHFCSTNLRVNISYSSVVALGSEGPAQRKLVIQFNMCTLHAINGSTVLTAEHYNCCCCHCYTVPCRETQLEGVTP